VREHPERVGVFADFIVGFVVGVDRFLLLVHLPLEELRLDFAEAALAPL